MEITNELGFGAMITCAIRYCLGRQTYMPHLIMDFIRPYLSKIDNNTLYVMIRDIEKADDYGNVDIDKPEWMKFLAECKAEYEKRGH